MSCRASDVKLVLLTFYILAPSVLPHSTSMYFLHALGWRIFHSFVLGFILKAQSEGKWLVRHYIQVSLGFELYDVRGVLKCWGRRITMSAVGRTALLKRRSPVGKRCTR